MERRGKTGHNTRFSHSGQGVAKHSELNLLRTLTTVSGMTLLSRITGLLRETIKATAFGAGLQMDAFEAAFRLPNLLRRLFAEGAFSQAFVPILAEYRRKRGVDATRRPGRQRRHAARAIVLIVLSVAGSLAAPWLVYLLAGGFARTPGKVELTAEMIRIVFPYILFVSLVSLAGGVLNVFRRFAIPAFTPVMLNLSIIGAAIFLAPLRRSAGRSRSRGASPSAGSRSLLLQIRPLLAIGMLPKPGFALARRRRAARAAGDGAGGDRRIGRADLGADQHAARRAARRRPHLVDHVRRPADGIPERAARRRARHDPAAVARAASQRRGQRASIRRCSTGGCGSPCCSRCRRRSRWRSSRCRSCRRSISTAGSPSTTCCRRAPRCSATASGLPALILVKILAPGFYARQVMSTPVKIAFVTVLVTQTLAVLFAWPLGLEQAGLTLATSIGAFFNAGCCCGCCCAEAITVRSPAGRAFLAKVCVARGHARDASRWSMGAGATWLTAGVAQKVGAPRARHRRRAPSSISARCTRSDSALAHFNRREAIDLPTCRRRDDAEL